MNAQAAAKKLLKKLKLPAHAATIWPWHGDRGVMLLVKIAPEYRYISSEIPTKFHGYEVRVETRVPPNAGKKSKTWIFS